MNFINAPFTQKAKSRVQESLDALTLDSGQIYTMQTVKTRLDNLVAGGGGGSNVDLTQIY